MISPMTLRCELANLADDKLIRLSAWDGREMRPYTSWRGSDEFIDSNFGDGHLHVDLTTPQ